MSFSNIILNTITALFQIEHSKTNTIKKIKENRIRCAYECVCNVKERDSKLLFKLQYLKTYIKINTVCLCKA